MKRWSLIKIVGLIGAVLLIVFGSVANMMRTVKVTFARISSKD